MTDHDGRQGRVRWLAGHWVAATWFLAGGLLAVLPVMASTLSLPVLLIYLHGPVYMMHQIEEHSRDRFRTFVNERVFGGRIALTVSDVLVINLPLVWGLNAAAFYAAWLGGAGLGMIAPYAMLVNGVSHAGIAVRLRQYNPGLGTSLLLFLPLSLTTLVCIAHAGLAGLGAHLSALLAALGIHLAIALSAFRRASRAQPELRAQARPSPRVD